MRHYGSMVGRVLIAGMLCLAVMLTASCSRPGITQKAQAIVDSMVKGDFQASTQDFDSTMKAQMPAKMLQQLWGQLTSQAGPFKSCAGTRESEEQGFKNVYVTCKFERRTLDVKVVFSSAGEVSGLWLVPTQIGPEVPGE